MKPAPIARAVQWFLLCLAQNILTWLSGLLNVEGGPLRLWFCGFPAIQTPWLWFICRVWIVLAAWLMAVLDKKIQIKEQSQADLTEQIQDDQLKQFVKDFFTQLKAERK